MGRRGDSEGINAIPEPPMPKRLLPFIPSSLRVIAVASEPERVTEARLGASRLHM